MRRTVPAVAAALLLISGCGGAAVDASVGTSVVSGSSRPCSSEATPVPDEVSSVSPLTSSLLPADATVVRSRVTPDGAAVLEGWVREGVPAVVESATLAVLAAGARVDRVEAEPREGFVAFTAGDGEGSLVAGPVRCPDDATGFVLTVPAPATPSPAPSSPSSITPPSTTPSEESS